MKLITQWSVRARLMWLVFLATLPAFALVVYLGGERRQQAMAVLRARSQNTLDTLVWSCHGVSGDARRLLSTLAETAALREPREMEAVFARVLAGSPQYHTLLAATPDGVVAASGTPLRAGAVVGERALHREALASRGMVAAADPQPGRPGLSFAMPVYTRQGQPWLVLHAGVSLVRLEPQLRRGVLPEGASVTLADSSGAVLFAQPDRPELLGRVEDAALARRLTNASDAFSYTRPDGRQVRVASRQIWLAAAGGPDLAAVLTVPADQIPGRFGPETRGQLGWLSVAAGLAMAGAWLLGTFWVTRPARALARVAERLAGGRLEAGSAAGGGELGELGARFNELAGRLARQEEERRRGEAALKESEERFRALMEHSTIGFLIARADRVEYANKSMARFCGCPSGADLAGTRVMEWLAEDCVAAMQERLARREAGDHDPFYYETTVRRRDGATLAVWVQSVCLELPEGRAVAAAVIDISKRKRTEEALQLSEARYRRLFDNMADAVFVHEVFADEPPGPFIEVNGVACQRLGYSREELLCRTPADIESPEALSQSAAAQRRLMAEGRALWEGVHLTKEGRRIPVEITNHLFEFNGKRLAFATARDITERKLSEMEKHRLEEQLRHAVKMEAVGRLAGGIAHDFNNITTGIIGYADMLLAQESLSAAARSDLSEIRRAADRAATLTRQLLAFSRKQIIAPVVLDLNLTIQELQQMLARLMGEDITVKWVPGHPLGRIKADRGQIEQVLVNLAVNARDAMPAGGTFAMETRDLDIPPAPPAPAGAAGPAGPAGEGRAGRWVVVSVSDTGCGMSPEMLEHIFEPFFTTKEQGKGVGLGLATVYGIIEQHGGFVTVHSAPGAGAAFKIHLPRVEEPVAKKEKAAPPAAMPRGAETILLVEDEPMVRNMVRRILQRLGYTVLEAACPADALVIWETRQADIDLLLTDVIMPGMNGRQLYDRLRAMNPELRALFMSGYSQDAIAHHGVLDEGISFTPKPCTGEELALKVRQVLDA